MIFMTGLKARVIRNFISGSVDEGLALETAKGFVFRRGEINKLPADEAKAAGGCAEKTEKRISAKAGSRRHTSLPETIVKGLLLGAYIKGNFVRSRVIHTL